jgi:protein-S-isoprenylcysteine O-methyltransferase Ste14
VTTRRAAALTALFLFGTALLGALIFVPAGRLDWGAGWLCLALMGCGFTAVSARVLRRTPSLLRRRARPGAGTPAWDYVLVSAFQLGFAAILIAGGLDGGRHRWAPLAPWLQYPGALLMVASLVLLGWAMGENPHFESTVRIQAELGHRVITTGPYRMVRHPGYAAGIALLLGMALTLGSGVALAVAALTALALVVRTALEDRFLRQRLPGYREFALRTRFRLVPGLW